MCDEQLEVLLELNLRTLTSNKNGVEWVYCLH